LWATGPKIKDALDVMEKWGFEYKTQMVWIKDRIGLGTWVRGQHELLLIGIKGDFPTPYESDRPPSVIQAPRGKHSEKPDIVYDIIEKMCPNRTYLEMFARGEAKKGWTVWGAEAIVRY
jgi:N6-adenosine-specific RNA methylase IME4